MPTSPPRQCDRCRRAFTGDHCSCAPRRGSTRRSRRQRHALLTAQPMCARTGHEWWWTGLPERCRRLATEDDHIVAISDGGDVDDPENRQGLCADDHKIKTAAERSRR